MVVELRDQNVRQQIWTSHAARDWTAGRWFLHHLLTAPTGLLDPGDLDHLHLGRDQVEQLADILAYDAQIASTVRAARAWTQFTTLAGGVSETRGLRRKAGADSSSGAGSSVLHQ